MVSKKFLKGFSNLFVCHKTDNIVKCIHFLSGFFHECKSNIERMVECVPESNYDQLRHFINESLWDSLVVMATVAEEVHVTLKRSPQLSTVRLGIGLILDESSWEKSGKKNVGVIRQEIRQIGKVINGQIVVFALVCSGEQVGLVQGRLYLP